jgi:hypothetical protein
MAKENLPQKENINEMLSKYKEKRGIVDETKTSYSTSEIPKSNAFNKQEFEKTMSKETDPDLMTSYEIIKLPSKGMFYSHGISEVSVEYMTSKDEDLLTTPSLIDSGNLLDILLKRKIKTPGINPSELLQGDRDAVILFLRTSSYGPEYTVQLPDPRTGVVFKSTVNLLKLKYKEIKESPNQNGHFIVQLPMRKKTIIFRLLTAGEDTLISKNAEAIKETYNEDFSQYGTMRLKASIIAINEKTDRSYIDKFVDAMPALDAITIRKKILEVSPDINMEYEFTTKDGYKFNALLNVGIDFFFPGT